MDWYGIARATAHARPAAPRTTSSAEIMRSAAAAALPLSAQEAAEIARTEAACLERAGRVAFAGSAAAEIIERVAPSPFLSTERVGESLCTLVAAFFELREGFGAEISDAEVADALADAFDVAAGEVTLALEDAADSLERQAASRPRTLEADDGTCYLAPADAWAEDVFAPGWLGETWEEADRE